MVGAGNQLGKITVKLILTCFTQLLLHLYYDLNLTTLICVKNGSLKKHIQPRFLNEDGHPTKTCCVRRDQKPIYWQFGLSIIEAFSHFILTFWQHAILTQRRWKASTIMLALSQNVPTLILPSLNLIVSIFFHSQNHLCGASICMSHMSEVACVPFPSKVEGREVPF